MNLRSNLRHVRRAHEREAHKLATGLPESALNRSDMSRLVITAWLLCLYGGVVCCKQHTLQERLL